MTNKTTGLVLTKKYIMFSSLYIQSTCIRTPDSKNIIHIEFVWND